MVDGEDREIREYSEFREQCALRINDNSTFPKHSKLLKLSKLPISAPHFSLLIPLSISPFPLFFLIFVR